MNTSSKRLLLAGAASCLLGAALRVFGIIPLVTGLIGWSPFYALFGWSTHRPGSTEKHHPPQE